MNEITSALRHGLLTQTAFIVCNDINDFGVLLDNKFYKLCAGCYDEDWLDDDDPLIEDMDIASMIYFDNSCKDFIRACFLTMPFYINKYHISVYNNLIVVRHGKCKESAYFVHFINLRDRIFHSWQQPIYDGIQRLKIQTEVIMNSSFYLDQWEKSGDLVKEPIGQRCIELTFDRIFHDDINDVIAMVLKGYAQIKIYIFDAPGDINIICI